MKRHDGGDVLLRQILKQRLKMKVIGVKIMKMNHVRPKAVHEGNQVSGRPFRRVPLAPRHAGVERMSLRFPRLSDYHTRLGHRSGRMGDSDVVSVRGMNGCELFTHPTGAFHFVDGIDV